MQRLSDSTTRQYKVRMATFLLVATSAITVSSYLWRNKHPTLFGGLSFVVILACCVLWVLWRRYWYIADDGGLLIIRRGSREVRVPVGEIADIYAVAAMYNEGIEVALRNPIEPFGAKIVFMPPKWTSVERQQMDEIASEIKLRLLNAKAT